MITDYLESNEDENSIYQNLWHEVRPMCRGEYMAVNRLLVTQRK